jgi:hypothetical protein
LKGIVYVFIKIDVHSIADGKIDKTYDLMKVKLLAFPLFDETILSSGNLEPVLSVLEKDPNIMRVIYLLRPRVSMIARYRFTSLFLT